MNKWKKKIFKYYESINNSNGDFIPSIKNSETFEKIPSIYYLNIYKYNKETSVSIVDNFKLYKSYDFKFEENFYVKNIELPIKDNYYILLKPVIPDKEFLSYKSFLIKDDDKYWNDANSLDLFGLHL